MTDGNLCDGVGFWIIFETNVNLFGKRRIAIHGNTRKSKTVSVTAERFIDKKDQLMQLAMFNWVVKLGRPIIVT